MENVKYFEVKNPKDYHVGKWLKRPRSKEILDARKVIVGRKIKIIIGVSTSFVNDIVKEYKKKKEGNKMYSIKREDLTDIANKFEISTSLIRVVLEGEELIK
tara:strand:- start:1679 stop:1984 length:306 start_codon:yes stop_codon:yes gene_type:complete